MKIRDKNTGTIVELKLSIVEPNGSSFNDREVDSFRGELLTLQKLTENFEDVTEENKRPKYGDRYYCLGFARDEKPYGSFLWAGDAIDEANLAIGNIFKTTEEVKKVFEYLKARKVLFDDTKGFKPDWKDNRWRKYRVVYDDSERCLRVDYGFSYTVGPIPYFDAEADARSSIAAHEKEWKIYLGVE